MSAENITIDDVLVFLKDVHSKFHATGRKAQEVPMVLPPEEKLQEAHKIISDFLADWKFWRQHCLVTGKRE